MPFLLQACGLFCAAEQQLELVSNFTLAPAAGLFSLGVLVSMGNGSSTTVVLNGTVSQTSAGLTVTQASCVCILVSQLVQTRV